MGCKVRPLRVWLYDGYWCSVCRVCKTTVYDMGEFQSTAMNAAIEHWKKVHIVR
jgi:hypothetical protein